MSRNDPGFNICRHFAKIFTFYLKNYFTVKYQIIDAIPK